MGRGFAASMYKYQYPIVFGSAVIAAITAFINREYFKAKIRGQGEELFKNDPESVRILEKFKEDQRKRENV